jgi:rhamnogalacturonyl hydrolase YesR
MILDVIINDQRAKVVKFSKEIIHEDTFILSGKSENRYSNNVLWHLTDLDFNIWCTFLFMSIIVTVLIKYMKKVTFSSAIWMVIVAILLKRKKYLNCFY